MLLPFFFAQELLKTEGVALDVQEDAIHEMAEGRPQFYLRRVV